MEGNSTSEEEVRCPFCNRRHRVLRSSSNSDGSDEAPVGEILGGAALAASASGLAAPLVANAGLKSAGFTGKGVGRGSLASKIQSKQGNVQKGSAFAKTQSFGAKGGFSQLGWLALGGALVAGAAALGYGVYQHEKEKRQQKEEELRNKHNVCKECWETHKDVFMRD